MQKLRHFFQAFFLAAAAILTIRNLAGYTKGHVESYCPAGGLESIVFFLKNNAFLCATTGINLILFLAIGIGTVIMGRAFCSWVCPVGAMMEALRWAGRKIGLAREAFWKGPGKVLGYARYPLLIVILYFTYLVADLVFRAYCPYYVIFSGQEHEIAWWSKWLMLGIVGGSLVLPFAWCMIACPLGAVLGLGRLVSPIAPSIDPAECTACGSCSRACPQQIEVQKAGRVWGTDCTQCLSCIESCPKSCLQLGLGYTSKKGKGGYIPSRVSWKIIPVLVVLMMGVGFLVGFRYPLPTMSKQYPIYSSGASFSRVDLIVKGFHCRGTGNTLGWILEQDPGVAYLEGYANEARVRVLYDAARTSVSQMVECVHRGRLFKNQKTQQEKLLQPFTVEKAEPVP